MIFNIIEGAAAILFVAFWVFLIYAFVKYKIAEFMTALGFKSNNAQGRRRNHKPKQKPYIDSCSAIEHGMEIDEVISYNSGDIDTRLKYVHVADSIERSDSCI